MSEAKTTNVLLEVKHLKKYFKTKGGLLHAVDDVSFTIGEGKTLGVVGESGCGKSTLMKRVAAAAEERGLQVEYIRCSGDPDSLDAILLPEKKTAIVDGTAPHERAAIGPFTGTSI